jgi:hypothetical protein
MKMTHGPSPSADEDVLGAGRAVDEVPGLQSALLALDEEQALAGQHEKVLLVRLGVVEPARLSGLDDLERDSELREPVGGEIGPPAKDGHAALEDAPRAEGLVREPRSVLHVDDEPAFADRR